MYNMLVVDDEYLVRKGIKETIDWAAHNVVITHEAKHGEEALAIVKNHDIDIIITDIRMPVMDGVALIRALGDEDDIGIVVLSGYQDFDYAKQALESGAQAYLLKPVSNDELVSKVCKVIVRLEASRSRNRLVETVEGDLTNITRQLVRDFLRGHIDHEAFVTKAASYNLPLINCGVALYVGDEVDDLRGAHAFAAKLTHQFKVNDWLHYDVYDDDEHLIIIDSDNASHVYDAVCEALQDADEPVETPLMLGLSGVFDTGHTMPKAADEAKRLAQRKPYRLINMVMTPSGELPLKPQMKSVLQHIAEHYHENITVRSVAEALYMSESNVMHAFKDQLNMTFNEYVTSYRLTKAKALLRTGKHHVYEVAAKVGYGDVKYFSQVFKKHLGMTPSDFIKRVGTS